MDLFTVLRNIYLKIKKNINVERITNSEIDDAFGGASGTTIKAQDYVIEHGINGNWKWRKWASGSFEAQHTIGVNPSGSTSAVLFTNADLNSRFGVSDSTSQNTVVTVCNADATASSAHVEGATNDGTQWYAVFDRSVSGSIYITVMINYFTS